MANLISSPAPLPDVMTLPCRSAQIQEALELDQITTHHWQIQGCSAVTGAHLLEGMDWVTDDIASRIYMME